MFGIKKKGPNALRGGQTAGKTLTRSFAAFVATIVATAGLVLGIVAPGYAHHPVVDGNYACDTALGDKFDLSFTVESDADYNKDWFLSAVTTSPSNLALTWNRPPGTATDDQNDFVATVQDVPAGDYTLTVTAKWHKKGYPNKDVVTQTGSKTLKPRGDCKKEVPVPPQPPSKDDCNPPGVTNNVVWVPETGPVDTAEYDWTLNNDESLTVKPQPGKKFPGELQSKTYYKPKDSGEKCPQSIPGSATATPTACSAPGQATGSATITVTNTDDATNESETYTVTLGNQVKSITLADGASGTVEFNGLTAGNISWSVVGDDGTKVNNTVTVAACVVTPPPVTPPTDVCVNIPGNQPEGTDCTPATVVAFDTGLQAGCVTHNLGEFSGFVKNFKRSTKSVYAKVKLNGKVVKRGPVMPGSKWSFSKMGVPNGSSIQTLVNGKVVDSAKIKDGCNQVKPPPSGGKWSKWKLFNKAAKEATTGG